MPTQPPQDAPALEDYADFLAAVDASGVGFAVIGGAAVGLYARLLGEAVISADPDIVVSERELPALLALVERLGAVVEKKPQPRSIPVAFVRWRGLEVNALTSSAGLPPAERVGDSAREMVLSSARVSVPVADPMDLLQNKLAVSRPKDLPHIEILRRFICSEAITDFGDPELSPRGRIRTIRRYLEVSGFPSLPDDLFSPLLAVSRDPTTRRFLLGHAETRVEAESVLGMAADNAERTELEQLLQRRFDA